MAAVSGSSIVTSAGPQVAQKTPSHEPFTHLETANSQSDDDASSDSESQSGSSPSDGSESGFNADESTGNIAVAAAEVASASIDGSQPTGFTTHHTSGRNGTTGTGDAPNPSLITSKGESDVLGSPTMVAAAPVDVSVDTARSSVDPTPAMQPSVPQTGRHIAPNGTTVDPFRGANKDVAPGYRPKLLQPEDGRVTATIPHKLRGSINNNSGQFATIHMDLPSTTRQERVSAAQRSSEATVAAANKANQAALAARRSSEAVVAAAERANRLAIPQPKRQGGHPDAPLPAHPPPYSHFPPHGFPARLPLPQETKMEQTRLLTLLRAIDPNSIVDQLCKGLAYFGGIPGSSPPPNGGFPLSEHHNGSGALFVSWLSEIFPPVYPAPGGYSSAESPFAEQPFQGGKAQQSSQLQSTVPGSSEVTHNPLGPGGPASGPPIDTVVVPRRKRGRPKGSKSSKPRKDKGIKKGPNPNRPTAHNTDASGIEIESATGEATVTASVDPSGSQAPDAQIQGKPAPNLTPSGKRRGRPPGSKNKPKALPLGEMNTLIAQAAPAVDDVDVGYHRHTLPNDSPPTVPRRVLLLDSEPWLQRQRQPQQSMAALPTDQLSSPTTRAPSQTTASQTPASRKRRLSNNADDRLSHNEASLRATAAQEASSHAADSQVFTDPDQSHKRRRASNGLGDLDRPAEVSQTESTSMPAPIVSPTVNTGAMTGPSGSATSGSSVEGGTQAGRTSGVRQSGIGQQRTKQISSLAQKQQQQQQQQSRQGQNPSPATAQSLQQPGQQPGASVVSQTPLVKSQATARQPATYNNPLQKPPLVAQSWQRTMVGPQQAANPDAQPVAREGRYAAQQPDSQRR